MIVVSGAALDLKEHIDQKDLLNRYGRQDIIFVLLDKRIDHLADDIKELKGEVKGLRGEIGKTNERIDGLYSQMVSMKMWGIGLLITILLVVLAPHILSMLG